MDGVGREDLSKDKGGNHTVNTREENSTAWFVGIIVALALIMIAYLVYSGNRSPSATGVESQPVQFTTIVGSTVVGADGTALILKSLAGACHTLERTNGNAPWYMKAIDCPTTAVATPEAPATK